MYDRAEFLDNRDDAAFPAHIGRVGEAGRIVVLPGMSAVRVLIVEDELILAMDLEDALMAAGYEVVGLAADMHQAILLAERHRPDVAIMDVNLARGTNGVDTARQLRERFDVPSLFVSGNIDAKMKATAAECRPLGFVPKPFSHKDLLTHIAQVAA